MDAVMRKGTDGFIGTVSPRRLRQASSELALLFENMEVQSYGLLSSVNSNPVDSLVNSAML
jgi:hypothetical protein